MEVSDEIRILIQEQFAECQNFEDTAVLYSNLNKVIDTELRNMNEILIENLGK